MIFSASALQDKCVLVTGSSRGIGAGIAKFFAAHGARVAVTYASSAGQAEKLMTELSGDGHLLIPLNVADETSVTQCFDMISAKWGKIDGLVNNAGITRDGLLVRMKADDFQAVLDANLKGVFLCTKAAVKMMMKARTGSIVTVTSVIGQTGNPGQCNYAASKAGAEAFCKSIAQEVGSRGIRVNCVAPGFIETDMTDALNETQKQAILAKVPLESLGQVNDVAQAALFLLSDASRYVTGHTLNVNGGLFM